MTLTCRVALAALAGLALASCGNDGDARPDEINVVYNGTPAVAAGPAPEEVRGQEFVSTVSGAFEFILTSARLAEQKSGRKEVQAYAANLASDVEGASGRLDPLRKEAGLQAAVTDGPVDGTDLAILQSAGAGAFELAFAKQQTDRLTELVGLMRAYKNGGNNPALRAWAEREQGLINERLMDAQTLVAELETEAES